MSAWFLQAAETRTCREVRVGGAGTSRSWTATPRCCPISAAL